jgi:hypothetical protein
MTHRIFLRENEMAPHIAQFLVASLLRIAANATINNNIGTA